MPVEITVSATNSAQPTKRVALVDGKIVNNNSACRIAHAQASLGHGGEP